MKVKATKKYEELNLSDAELKRIPKEGEEFEVSEERYKVLSGNNKYKAIFVEKVEEVKEVEVAVKEETKETAVKKARKKSK